MRCTRSGILCVMKCKYTQSNTTDLYAVQVRHHTTRDCLVAAVATIVLTPFVVVLIIAIAVSLVLGRAAALWFVFFHARGTAVARQRYVHVDQAT